MSYTVAPAAVGDISFQQHNAEDRAAIALFIFCVPNAAVFILTTSFYRDVGMRGWQGGEDGTKVIIFGVDMPHCEANACV